MKNTEQLSKMALDTKLVRARAMSVISSVTTELENTLWIDLVAMKALIKANR